MSDSDTRRVGVIMNGVTGRMGTHQHLMRSIVEIRRQGGALASDGTRVMPDPILVGRNPEKLKHLVEISGIDNWTTDLDAALADDRYEVYFDAQTTTRRPEAVAKAVAAGKHIYCEKPTALTSEEALSIYHLARDAGLKNGVVQDKLFLPGLVKLRQLRDEGFFGRILSVKGDFGYYVFEGDRRECQRPSWNYKAEEGGGIVTDMFCHWRYVLDDLFGGVQSVVATAEIHIPQRWDEQGQPYKCTAEDAAYAIFELADGVVAQFNSSWATRVRRDDLLVLQVDGTEGSAVATLRQCRTQSYKQTPRPVWNPDVPQEIDFYADWHLYRPEDEFPNAFRVQWEQFLLHVACDAPFRWSLLEGAKGVQLAEAGLEACKQRRFVDLPELQ